MQITKLVDGDTLTLVINARLDTLTSPALQEEIVNSIEGVKHLVLDFKDVLYVSSSGLRVILMAQKEMSKKGDMVLLNVSDEIKQLFEMTGFSEILTIK